MKNSSVTIPFREVQEVKVATDKLNNASAVYIREGSSSVKAWPIEESEGDFLTITALNGPIVLGLECSSDFFEISFDAESWETLKWHQELVVVDEDVYVRLINRLSGAVVFTVNGGSASVRGDIMRAIGLYRSPRFVGDGWVDASRMFIQTVWRYDYQFEKMFANCHMLRYPPSYIMCSGDGCCREMFYGCTSLRYAPVIMQTALHDECYKRMFYGCTSLVTAPFLPDERLAPHCYEEMFANCVSLEKAPVLPAYISYGYESQAEASYAGMFRGCSSLNEAWVRFHTSDDVYCNILASMFYRVAIKGTLHAVADYDHWYKVAGLPEQWIITGSYDS